MRIERVDGVGLKICEDWVDAGRLGLEYHFESLGGRDSRKFSSLKRRSNYEVIPMHLHSSD
jgi:hypothetical protein